MLQCYVRGEHCLENKKLLHCIQAHPAMLPQCGQGVRHGQHDHMIIGRNEIGVQHMIKVFAQELGVALG